VTFQHIDSMKFSHYMQQCMTELEQANELDTDQYLVYLIRIQHLTERICRVTLSTRDDAEASGTMPGAPVSAYLTSFQGELDRIRVSLRKPVKNLGMWSWEIEGVSADKLQICSKRH
jgi:hypothetical protein